MKPISQLTVVLSILITLSISAQQGINYKALIKDGGGNVVASQLITVQFTILKGVGMTNVYQETHTPTTDGNGVFIAFIGEGTPVSGIFAEIDWGSDTHALKTEIDTGDGLVDMGTTEFKAVPYALNVANAATNIDELTDGKSDSDGTQDGSSIFLGINAGSTDDSSDNRNVGIGLNALKSNTTGAYNTATGYNSLFFNTTGNYNTANGYYALLLNTGNNNTATGFDALYSNSTGWDNTANGFEALSLNTTGTNNTANGTLALWVNSIGIFNTANGAQSLRSNTTGNKNTAYGTDSGFSNISGNGNVFIGNESGYNETNSNKLYIENADADANNALIYGEFGADNTTAGNILRTNSQFQIGNPTGTGFAFPTVDGTANQVLLTNGNGSLSWDNTSVSSGLETLDEGNGIGWRIIGRDPNNYGNIGSLAVDLSYNNSLSSTRGATGEVAVAMGLDTNASGVVATAMGYNTIASGDSSTAMGDSSVASGTYSTVMGFATTASGYNSIAMGLDTKAEARNVLAIGRYNVGGGTATTWIETDNLFEVGNGSSGGSRSNAFTILKNGSITAPSLTNTLINTAGDKALITKEYADTNHNPTGLEGIDEGNGIGWRIIGRAPNSYGNIGSNAVDLSSSTFVSSSTIGATGKQSLAMGEDVIASGQYSTAMGIFTMASGDYSSALGLRTNSEARNVFAIGRYNVGGGNATNWVVTDNLFEVGNGSSEGSRNNAFTILKNGTITAPSLTNSLINTAGNKALLTKEYADANYNSTGLEALDESSGIGWRLIGRNPANYGNIGLNAVDLSYSETTSSTLGAKADFSTAMGYETTASGFYSTAMGTNTIASGQWSTAMGRDTTASGSFSTSMGAGTTASGNASTAMGTNTKAEALQVLAIGTYNIGGGNPTIYVETDKIFEVGNGLSEGSRANAFTILKNGNVGIGTAVPSENLYIYQANGDVKEIIESANGGADLHIKATGTNNPSISFYDNGVFGGSIGYSNANDYLFINGGGNFAFKNGNFGIGTNTPAVKLHIIGGTDASYSNGSGYIVMGNETSSNIVIDTNEIIARNNGASANLHLQTDGGDVYVGGGLVHSSDRRLKQNIENLTYGLDEILQLRPVSYYWKSNPNTKQKSLGLIAQEVQPLIQELVMFNENRDKTLALDYNGLIPILVKAIQEQQEVIQEQKAELKTQNKNFEKLLKRVEQLEISSNQ